MSHIRDIEELYKLRDYLRILNDKNITRKQLNNILDDLIPKNEKGKKLIGTVVSEVPTKKPAIYLPKFNSIRMSRLDFLNYTKKKSEEFAENTNLGLRFVRELEQGKLTLKIDKILVALNFFNSSITVKEWPNNYL